MKTSAALVLMMALVLVTAWAYPADYIFDSDESDRAPLFSRLYDRDIESVYDRAAFPRYGYRQARVRSWSPFSHAVRNSGRFNFV